MMLNNDLSRRSFLALAAAAPLVSAAKKRIPVGLELFSVRDELAKDLEGRSARSRNWATRTWSSSRRTTIGPRRRPRKSANCWTIWRSGACPRTTERSRSSADGIQKAIDLNSILGAKFVVLASAGQVKALDGWKRVAETLTKASEKFAFRQTARGLSQPPVGVQTDRGQTSHGSAGCRHAEERDAATRRRHLCRGGLRSGGLDQRQSGRINCIHCKDWSPEKGYKVLFGEGKAPWKEIFQAAEKTGGVEFYLIEQEGSPCRRLKPRRSASPISSGFTDDLGHASRWCTTS